MNCNSPCEWHCSYYEHSPMPTYAKHSCKTVSGDIFTPVILALSHMLACL